MKIRNIHILVTYCKFLSSITWTTCIKSINDNLTQLLSMQHWCVDLAHVWRHLRSRVNISQWLKSVTAVTDWPWKRCLKTLVWHSLAAWPQRFQVRTGVSTAAAKRPDRSCDMSLAFYVGINVTSFKSSSAAARPLCDRSGQTARLTGP